MVHTYLPGQPGYQEAAARWAQQWGHPTPQAGKDFTSGHGAVGPAGVDLAILEAELRVELATVPDRLDRSCGKGCPGCTYGQPCQRPVSEVEAIYRKAQAEADLVDLQRTAYRWEVAHGRLV